MGNTWHVHSAAAAATTGHLGMAAASGGLLRLRLFFLLIIGVHARDESKENQETNDLLHKRFEFSRSASKRVADSKEILDLSDPSLDSRGPAFFELTSRQQKCGMLP